MKHLLPLIFSQAFFKKIFAIACLVILFYVFRGFLGLFLITFIFAYLSLEVAEFLRAKIIFQKEKNPNKFWKFFEKYLSTNIGNNYLYSFYFDGNLAFCKHFATNYQRNRNFYQKNPRNDATNGGAFTKL